MTETDDLHDSTEAAQRKKRIRELSEEMSRAVDRETHRQHHSPAHQMVEKRLPALELPGFGERLEDCGKDLPHFCLECGSSATFGRTCRRSTCPRCASSWCRDQSESVFKRLLSLLKLEQSRNGRAFPHHLAISPPSGWLADADDQREALEAGFDAVRGIMDALGIQGVAFYHPYRGKDEHRDGADDRGEWSKRLFSDRDWQGDVRDDLKVSPHFHVIAVSPFIPGGQATKRLHDETGWIVERIADDDSGRSIGRSGDIDRDLAGVVSYALSHTGIYETESGDNKSAYRYIGADLNGIHVDQDTEEKAERLVREVAWKTLGIPSANMVCGSDVARVAGDCGSECEHDHGAGDVEHVDDETSAGAGGGDDRETEETPEEPTGGTVERDECDGELVSLGAAPKKLESEEWVQNAVYVDETVAALREYAPKEDWIMDALRRSDVTENDHHVIERLRELQGGG
jgi:hypothetical protein